MSVFSGYFNSRDHDRQYNAEEISRLFDGLINDGIFRDYMDGLKVVSQVELNEEAEDTMYVIVMSGRCWFNHTWMLNDTVYTIKIDSNDTEFIRIDAIVIDVDLTDDVRETSIKIVKGTADGNFPILTRESFHMQYPLAYITVNPNAESITSEDINDRRGANTVLHNSEGDEKGFEYGTPFSYLLLGNAGLKTNIPGLVMEGFKLEKEDAPANIMEPNLFYGVIEEIPDE